MLMKRFRYIFFAALLAMMWLGINVYADEYDGLDFDYGSVLGRPVRCAASKAA